MRAACFPHYNFGLAVTCIVEWNIPAATRTSGGSLSLLVQEHAACWTSSQNPAVKSECIDFSSLNLNTLARRGTERQLVLELEQYC